MFQTVQVDNLILKECMYSSNKLFEPKFGGSLLTWLWFQTSIIPTIPHSILQACRLSFFPGGLTGKEFTCSVKDLGLIPGFGKIPWRRERLPTAVFWPGEFRELYSSWGRKESDMTEWLSLSLLAKLLQLCLTLQPHLCSPPGSSVHGILQTRILEWVSIPSSRGSSGPRDWTRVRSCLLHLLHWQTGSLPLAPPGNLLF